MKRNAIESTTTSAVKKKKQKRMFPCQICSKEFLRPALLLRHQRIHTGEQPFTCDICDRSFNQKISLQKHLFTHGNVRPFKCKSCDQSYSQRTNLNRHIKRCHTPIFTCSDGSTVNETARVSCPNCTCSFKKYASLHTHIKRIHGQMSDNISEECIESDEGFDIEKVMRQLQQLEDEDCAKETDNSAETETTTNSPLILDEKRRESQSISLTHSHHNKLLNHKAADQSNLNSQQPLIDIRMVNPLLIIDCNLDKIPEEQLTGKCDPRPYICTVCSAAFKRNSALKEHSLIHLNVRNHKCNVCEKSFLTRSVYNRHMKFHMNIRPHKCVECGLSFTMASSLKRHKLVHTDVRNVMCSYCLKTFKSRDLCRSHMKLHKADLVNNLLEGTSDLPKSNNPSYVQGNKDLDNIRNVISEEIVSTSSLKLPISSIGDLENLVIHEDAPVSTNTDANPLMVVHFVNQDNSEPMLIFTTDCQFPLFDNRDVVDVRDVVIEETVPEIIVDSTSDHLSKFIFNDQINHIEENQREPITGLNTDENDCLASLESDNVVETPVSNGKHQESMGSKTCSFCGKIFKKPIDCRRHLRTHTGDRPFSCTHCSASFAVLSTLNTHLIIHSDNKTLHQCKICSKRFSLKHGLQIHERIHTGIRPYQCTYCDLTFRTSTHQRSHIQIHLREASEKGIDPGSVKMKKSKSKLLSIIQEVDRTMEKIRCENNREEVVAEKSGEKLHKVKNLFPCRYCQLPYCTTSARDRHEVIHYTNDKSYSCAICRKCFKQKSSLIIHMTRCFKLNTESNCKQPTVEINL